MDSVQREHSWASIALFFSCFQFQMSCRRSVWQHRRPQDLGRTLSALCICFMDVLRSSSTQKSCYNQSSTQTTTHWLSRWLWGEINGANIISQRSLALISIFRFCVLQVSSSTTIITLLALSFSAHSLGFPVPFVRSQFILCFISFSV